MFGEPNSISISVDNEGLQLSSGYPPRNLVDGREQSSDRSAFHTHEDIPSSIQLNGKQPTNAVRNPMVSKLNLLPTLRIPKSETDPNHLRPESLPSSEGTTPGSETPGSLASPIVGVVDLTTSVKTISPNPVGLGGYSDIYQGEWERRDANTGVIYKELIAIKLLRILSASEEADAKARKRLNREVYVWHRLEHPNIVTFLGTTYHMGGRPAMVMQWLKNGSALDFLKKNPNADRHRLVSDIAKGLTYLHTLKSPIIHGDLKSTNVLINDDGHAVLSDFGLSRVIEDLMGTKGLTISNAEACPIRWQAPEFMCESTYGATLATDVWAFGCTAYEILTGKFPYPHRKHDVHVIYDIQNGISPAGPEGETNLPLLDLLKECWVPDPAHRIRMLQVQSLLLGDP